MFTVVHLIYTQSKKIIFLQKKQLTISQDIIGSHFDYWLFHIYKIPLSLKDIKSREEGNVSTRLFLKPHFTIGARALYDTFAIGIFARSLAYIAQALALVARVLVLASSLLTVLHCKPHEGTRMKTFKSFQKNPRTSEQKQMLDFPIKNLH